MSQMLNREMLGRIVRVAWMAWALEQPERKPSWLTGWDELEEPQREVDRRIGEAVEQVVLVALQPDHDAVHGLLTQLAQAAPSGGKDAAAQLLRFTERAQQLLARPLFRQEGT